MERRRWWTREHDSGTRCCVLPAVEVPDDAMRRPDVVSMKPLIEHAQPRAANNFVCQSFSRCHDMGRAAVASLHVSDTIFIVELLITCGTRQIVEEDTPVTLSSAKCKRRDDGGSREQRP